MKPISNPHDLFFKEAFSHPEAVHDFLRYYLPPAIAQCIDLSSIEVVTDTFVDEQLHEQFSDLICRPSTRPCVFPT